MHTRLNAIPAILCALTCLLVSGCLEITTTNEVKNDGSITRTVTIVGDSSDVVGAKYPLRFDSTWSRTLTNAGERKCTLTVSKTFRDTGEMNAALKGTFGETVQYQVKLDKSFRWFFTVYRYEETNLPFAQFTSIPMKDYFSQKEIDWFVTKVLQGGMKEGEKSLEDSLTWERLKPRGEEWISRNHFEPFFAVFLDGVRKLNDLSLPPSVVESLKDSLYRHAAQEIESKHRDTLPTIFAHILHSSAATKVWGANAPAFEEYWRKLEFEQEVGSHNFVTSVTMPGLITGSNASELQANKAGWKDFIGKSAYFEYTMWVESRQVNWWAIIVAAVVIVVLTALLIISTLKRRNGR